MEDKLFQQEVYFIVDNGHLILGYLTLGYCIFSHLRISQLQQCYFKILHRVGVIPQLLRLCL